jgi:hypothetical protein
MLNLRHYLFRRFSGYRKQEEGSVLKDLKLEDLLRYGFSGGLLLIVVLLEHPAWADVAKASGIGGTAILTALALLAGSLIYALHRAFAYRILLALVLLLLMCFRAYRWDVGVIKPLRPSETEMEIDRLRLHWRKDKDALDSITAEWGAQVHLLYCSGWAILLGVALSQLFKTCQSIISNQTYYLAAAILTLVAIWHNARLLWWIKANEHQHFRKAPPKAQEPLS